MMIEKPVTSGDIVTIKMTTGDEIIARLLEMTQDQYIVSKPQALMVTDNGMGLGPFAFTVHPDTKIPINKSTVVFCVKTDPATAKTYVGSTSSLAVI
jgi:hypothetical protein